MNLPEFLQLKKQRALSQIELLDMTPGYHHADQLEAIITTSITPKQAIDDLNLYPKLLACGVPAEDILEHLHLIAALTSSNSRAERETIENSWLKIHSSGKLLPDTYTQLLSQTFIDWILGDYFGWDHGMDYRHVRHGGVSSQDFVDAVKTYATRMER